MTELLVEPTSAPDLFTGSFDDFSLSPELMLGLKDLGYTKPTYVQREVFEPVRSGQDFVVQSHTGSGKTTAFCLPMLSMLEDKKVTQAIVLVPTRELARQVATECGRIAHHCNLKIAAVYGGASFEAQTAALKSGAQVVVGTPGRVKDMFERRILDVSNIKIAVLDEADEMLSMGFWEDVTYLLGRLPKTRQTLFFSATIPAPIESALGSLLKNPQRINLSSDNLAAKTVRHVAHIEDDSQPKYRNLLYALEFHNPRHAVIFCNTKDETELLERYLRRFGFHVRALNGDMSQSARERVMADVKSGSLDMIIATDIAARGIDISGLTHVFNYELPENDEVYVHRTGRTGRIGASGVAVSLVRGKDVAQLGNLRNKFDLNFEEIALPSETELLWMQGERLAILLTEEADGVEVSQYRPVAEAMLSRGDVGEIVAFLLRAYYSRTVEPMRSPEKEAPKHDKKHESRDRKPKERREPREQREPREPREAREPEAAKPHHKPVIILAKDRKPEIVAPVQPPILAEREEEEDDTGANDDMEAGDEPREDFKRLYITLGRNDGFASLSSLMHYISLTSGVDLGHFTGMGHVRDTSSHVEVDMEVAGAIINAMNGRSKSTSAAPSESGEPAPTVLCEEAKGNEPPRKHFRHKGRR